MLPPWGMRQCSLGLTNNAAFRTNFVYVIFVLVVPWGVQAQGLLHQHQFSLLHAFVIHSILSAALTFNVQSRFSVVSVVVLTGKLAKPGCFVLQLCCSLSPSKESTRRKMPLGHCEAAKVLLDTPELVEKPLPFIDLETTFHLAQTRRVTREILIPSGGN